MAVRIGQLLDGKYRVVRVLGKGGMGAVYEGENTFISRRVAIKVLHANLMLKPDIVSRFELEAQAAGRIQNDHINEVLDLGTLEDGSRFIVLEFLEGETLKDRVKRAGRLTPMQAVHVVRQVLVGLSAAHRAGIVHRDLKPGNVFILWEKLGQRDFVKIIDFGVSKFLLSRESEALDVSHATAVLGTPHYMAPEQLRRSGDVDARADLYSVGIILYKAVTGRVPYHAQSIQELVTKLRDSAPVSASQWVAGLDSTFVRILDKAIERDASKRFQSADEFLAELEQWRMEMAATELPFFTEDGLISTMHNVSLRRGSSSDVSVPPVHVSSRAGDSVSLQELSEISVESLPNAVTVPRKGPAAAASEGPSQAQNGAVSVVAASPSPRRMKVAAAALALVAIGCVGAGAWYFTRTSQAGLSSSVPPTAAAPADTSAPAVAVSSPASGPTALADDPGEPEKKDEGVISISDLPPEVAKQDPYGGRNTGPPPSRTDSTATKPPVGKPPKGQGTASPDSTGSEWGY
jgi:serine/threonine-protein kinase